MNDVLLSNGYKIDHKQLVEDLSNDNIVIREPNQEVMDTVGHYYNSFLQRNIISNRYDSVDDINKYFKTKLSDIINMEFLEGLLPELKDSSKIILETIKNNGKILLISDFDSDQNFFL